MNACADCANCVAAMDFLVPRLSLPTQLEMEMDRRAAARLSRDQIAIKMDELIQQWYYQHAVIDQMLGKIRQLQVELALKDAPLLGAPTADHHQWARDLLSQKP